jgi:L-alanine-DL-glutamate epimerase-like enolase superfamily enzyme
LAPARAHALKVIAGKVKIHDAPGWGFTPNPDWIAKAPYLVSERPATP